MTLSLVLSLVFGLVFCLLSLVLSLVFGLVFCLWSFVFGLVCRKGYRMTALQMKPHVRHISTILDLFFCNSKSYTKLTFFSFYLALSILQKNQSIAIHHSFSPPTEELPALHPKRSLHSHQNCLPSSHIFSRGL